MGNTEYITLRFTEKELAQIIDGIDTLEGMQGVIDQDFNEEVEHCVKSFDKVLSRVNLKRSRT